MPAGETKLQTFYRNFFLHFVGALRALSLYPPEHPEIERKISTLFQGLAKYLSARPSLTLLFIRGEVVVENVPFPDLSHTLAQILKRFQDMRLERLVFQRGVTAAELLRFLRLLLKLMKNPGRADINAAMVRQQLPHIAAGGLPLDPEAQLSYEELSSLLKDARRAVFSVSDHLKDLFGNLQMALPPAKVSLAKEMVAAVGRMIIGDEVPLKVLIYRRTPQADPYLHAVNVCALSMALAQQLNLEEVLVADVGLGALLHDIGLHLLAPVEPRKTATITLDERKRQWEHPVSGARILAASPGLPDLVPLVAYEHHIHYDGGGYPPLEQPRQLNLASLITAVTNSFDNLRVNRPAHAALSLADTIRSMDRGAGTQFHPIVFKQFRKLVKAQAAQDL